MKKFGAITICQQLEDTEVLYYMWDIDNTTFSNVKYKSHLSLNEKLSRCRQQYIVMLSNITHLKMSLHFPFDYQSTKRLKLSLFFNKNTTLLSLSFF